MYEIVIDSAQFKGKRPVQQHRLVNEVRQSIDIQRESISMDKATSWLLQFQRMTFS